MEPSNPGASEGKPKGGITKFFKNKDRGQGVTPRVTIDEEMGVVVADMMAGKKDNVSMEVAEMTAGTKDNVVDLTAKEIDGMGIEGTVLMDEESDSHSRKNELQSVAAKETSNSKEYYKEVNNITREQRKRPRIDYGCLTHAEDTITSREVIHMLKKMVDAIKGLEDEISDLKETVKGCTCRNRPYKDQREVPEPEQIQFMPQESKSVGQITQESQKRVQEVVARAEKAKKEKPQSYLAVARQGNEFPAIQSAYKTMAGQRKIVGNKRDHIQFVAPKEAARESGIEEVNKELMKQMTLPPPKEPQVIEATTIRVERVMPRQKCPARDWRRVLKERNIKVFSILFPHPTTVEILIPTADEEMMKEFLGKIGRVATNPSPYIRRDGQQGELSQDIIRRSIESRIRMLEYETSGVGMRYLEKVIMEGITKVAAPEDKMNLTKKLEAAMTDRNWALTLNHS
jgi:hypothetical protein